MYQHVTEIPKKAWVGDIETKRWGGLICFPKIACLEALPPVNMLQKEGKPLLAFTISLVDYSAAFVSCRILGSCTGLMQAIQDLVLASKDLQREIVESGRVSVAVPLKTSCWVHSTACSFLFLFLKPTISAFSSIEREGNPITLSPQFNGQAKPLDH